MGWCFAVTVPRIFKERPIAEVPAMIEDMRRTGRKDAVLSPWGSSGTGMCRGRELR